MRGFGFIIREALVATIIVGIAATLSGCQDLNSRFGADRTNYSAAKEMPMLKLPTGSLAVSKRYDIPEIPGNKDLIVTDNAPPDYY